MSAERWLPVVGWEGLYWVSDHGRVRSSYHPDKIISGGKVGRGYRMFQLCRDGKITRVCVHRLVLLAFVGPCPLGYEGCHNDGKAWNNHISNLRWDTHKSNQADRRKHGTNTKHLAILTPRQVIRIRTEREVQDRTWVSRFGVSNGTIRNARVGFTFRDIAIDGFKRPRPYR